MVDPEPEVVHVPFSGGPGVALILLNVSRLFFFLIIYLFCQYLTDDFIDTQNSESPEPAKKAGSRDPSEQGDVQEEKVEQEALDYDYLVEPQQPLQDAELWDSPSEVYSSPPLKKKSLKKKLGHGFR